MEELEERKEQKSGVILRIEKDEKLRTWLEKSKQEAYAKVKKKNDILCKNKMLQKGDKVPKFTNIDFQSKHLQKKSTMSWLRRFKGKGRVPDDYLYLPKEKRQREELATYHFRYLLTPRIFLAFDDDGSNSLDLNELVDMIIDNYIANPTAQDHFIQDSKINKWIEPSQKQKVNLKKHIEKLVTHMMSKIYDLVSDNEGLSLEQFVNMCMDQRCNDILRSLMTKIEKIRDHPKLKIIGRALGMTKYLPFTFTKMGKHLCYQQRRKAIEEDYETGINVKKEHFPSQFDHLISLMQLNIGQINAPKIQRAKKRLRTKLKILRALTQVIKDDDDEYDHLKPLDSLQTNQLAQELGEHSDLSDLAILQLSKIRKREKYEFEKLFDNETKKRLDRQISKFMKRADRKAKRYMEVVKTCNNTSKRSFSQTAPYFHIKRKPTTRQVKQAIKTKRDNQLNLLLSEPKSTEHIQDSFKQKFRNRKLIWMDSDSDTGISTHKEMSSKEIKFTASKLFQRNSAYRIRRKNSSYASISGVSSNRKLKNHQS